MTRSLDFELQLYRDAILSCSGTLTTDNPLVWWTKQFHRFNIFSHHHPRGRSNEQLHSPVLDHELWAVVVLSPSTVQLCNGVVLLTSAHFCVAHAKCDSWLAVAIWITCRWESILSVIYETSEILLCAPFSSWRTNWSSPAPTTKCKGDRADTNTAPLHGYGCAEGEAGRFLSFSRLFLWAVFNNLVSIFRHQHDVSRQILQIEFVP